MMMSQQSDIKNGTCPKCDAHDIRLQHWSRRPNDFRNYLSLGWWGYGARVVNYVCVTCGYTESYIEAADIKKIAGRWERVEDALNRH